MHVSNKLNGGMSVDVKSISCHRAMFQSPLARDQGDKCIQN
jgi:hypothetical protein